MPVCVVPGTYDHKEYAILDDDLIHDASPDGDRKPDDDHPVTVADLLDAYDARAPFTIDSADLLNAVARADEATRLSYHRIARAVGASRYLDQSVASLSPEERAEFERRTT